jgi:hypothetical protein
VKRLALAALVCLPFVVPEHSNAGQLPPSGPFPDRPCNLAARMNIYVGPDGTLWECVCEALASGHACDWFDQGPVNARKLRRVKLRHPGSRVVYRYPKAVAL